MDFYSNIYYQIYNNNCIFSLLFQPNRSSTSDIAYSELWKIVEVTIYNHVLLKQILLKQIQHSLLGLVSLRKDRLSGLSYYLGIGIILHL